MKITSDQLIAGYPALQIRNFIRRCRFQYIGTSQVEEYLSLNSSKAAAFLKEMVDLGLIEPFTFAPTETPTYEVTTHGQALANASAAKPFTRRTANRLLGELMDRVQAINVEGDYAYEVESVVLFGSMLSEDKDRLGDVDLAIELAPVTSDIKMLEWFYKYRRRVARANGKRLATAFEWAAWPKLEIFDLLKSGSRSLSLHELCDLSELDGTPYRVLYGDPERLERMIREKHFRAEQTHFPGSYPLKILLGISNEGAWP